MFKNILYSALFIVLAWLSWCDILPIFQFVMFVPLLWIQHRGEGKGFMPWAIISLIGWNIATLWWLGEVTWLAPLAATLVHTTLFSLVLYLYNRVWRRASRLTSYTILTSGWVAAEWLYQYNSEISFPWINIGNSFGSSPWMVQWYEYTGILGGTLWVLLVNLLIFEAIVSTASKGWLYKKLAPALLLIIVPIMVSLYRYQSYSHQGKEVEVTALQPNIDPLSQHSGSYNQDEQALVFVKLMSKPPKETTFFIGPERALDSNFWLHTIDKSYSVQQMRESLYVQRSRASFIMGVLTYRRYPKDSYPTPPTLTARSSGNAPYYYDVYNSAISVNAVNHEVDVTHKSRLTSGVESMPFYKFLRKIGLLGISQGGMVSSFATDGEPVIFENEPSGVKGGTAISFESIYGQHFGRFVKAGADVMFIITDDSRWGDTPGYKQHLRFAQLRAIETRREIGRSANCGISGMIDARGDIIAQSSWGERTIVTATITTNDAITFYVKYGDYIGWVAAIIYILSILVFSYKNRFLVGKKV